RLSFVFTSPPPTDTSTLSLHDALPILLFVVASLAGCDNAPDPRELGGALAYVAWAVENDDPRALYQVVDPRARHAMISIVNDRRSEEHTSELQSRENLVCRLLLEKKKQ